MAIDVVVDGDGCLSVMLPLAINTIAIKFSEDDPDVAKMVAWAFTMFERFCTSDQGYAFYNDMMASRKLYDRVKQFVTMMLMVGAIRYSCYEQGCEQKTRQAVK